jgi:hypothetical protein
VKQSSSALGALAVAAGLTLALYLVPLLRPLAWPLILVSTLVHELGHGIAALLCGGRFESLNHWPDASGAASFAGNFGAPSRALVAAAGPLAPPLAAVGFFLGARQPRPAHVALGVLAAALALITLIWVRTAFGWIFVLGLAGTLALIAWRGGAALAQAVCAFLGLQLCLAAFSRADYLFTSVAHTGGGDMPSDMQQVADALLLPYWFWGGAVALVSLLVLALGLRAFSKAL